MLVQSSKLKVKSRSLKLKVFIKLINFGLLIVIFNFALLTLNWNNASAQEQFRTMTIVPPAIQQKLNPGDKVEGKMKIINDSLEPISFNIGIRDYIVVDTQGTPNFLPPNTLNKKYSASSWIAVFPTTFTVQPKEKQELMYYIQVPADARPGGHYAGSVYTALNPYGSGGTGADVQTQLGTLFYIDVAGAITESSKATITANPFQEYGPVEIKTQINNLGDLHVKPFAKIVVTDIFGNKIETTKLNETNIFPSSARDYINTVGPKLMIGPFKAQLTGTYGRNNNLPIVATITFWVFPWRVTVVVILVIIAAVLGWKLWKKRKVDTQTNTEKNTETTQTSQS